LELLGSGQFGQVYSGIKLATKEAVAIKVIDKTRFNEFNDGTSIFQSEITLLYNLKHPGIIKLFALFDQSDKVLSI
jgi:serine/threonine protein kinase